MLVLSNNTFEGDDEYDDEYDFAALVLVLVVLRGCCR
jgi:hypothetical protein